MSRIITVKGTGTVSSKPDTVVLTMDLDSRHAEYGIQALSAPADDFIIAVFKQHGGIFI